MAAQTAISAQHATLSTTVQDVITFSYDGAESLCVTNHDATNKLYFTCAAKNEVQTLTLSGGAVNDTVKLTFNGHESADPITFPAGGYANTTAAQVKACLITIADWTTNSADIAVVKATNDYAITFTGALGKQDIGAITVTSKVGAGNGSVAETQKGGAVGLGDDTYVVLPSQSKVVKYPKGAVVYVVGNGNIYSAEIN